LLQPFSAETWAVGLRRGDDTLKRQIDDFLNRFRAGGGFEKLGDEFLADEKAFFNRQKIPFFF